MAIISVKEIHDGRDGLVDAVGGVTSYTRVFRVITNDNLTEAAAIISDPRVPSVGSAYPYDPQCWLQRIVPKNESHSKRFWTVTCDYATSKSGDGKNIDHDNPLFEMAKVSFSSESFEFAINRDRNGKYIINTAGDPFVPPAHIDQYRQVWTIKKNISSPSYGGWNALGTLNSSAVSFQGNQASIAAQAGLCRSIQVSDWQVRNKVYYYTATITIVGPTRHSDGSVSHELETVNQGMRCWKRLPTPSGGETPDTYPVECTDGTGSPTKGPAFLDENGEQMDPKFNQLLYLFWPVYPLAAWSGLMPGIT